MFKVALNVKIALHLHVVLVYTPRPEFSSAMYTAALKTPQYHSLNSVSPNSLQISNLLASLPYAHKSGQELCLTCIHIWKVSTMFVRSVSGVNNKSKLMNYSLHQTGNMHNLSHPSWSEIKRDASKIGWCDDLFMRLYVLESSTSFHFRWRTTKLEYLGILTNVCWIIYNSFWGFHFNKFSNQIL